MQMDTANDAELLRRHVEQGDEAAFTEVVQRHVNLVYATAKRLAYGDAHLAEDVSQQVFTALAREARQLMNHPTLAGWLHTSTRNLTYKAIRTEGRRRAREQELYAMQNTATEPELHWEKLQPLLDEAVSRLDGGERDAVLLRYFEDKSYREVGERTGLNEEAARKRVDRAVDKLRSYFTRRGITVTAGLLGEVIMAHSANAAPAGLAQNLATTALAQAATPVATFSILKIILTMTTSTKIIIGTAALLIAAASYHYLTQPSVTGAATSTEPAKNNGAPAVQAPASPKATAGTVAALPVKTAAPTASAPASQASAPDNPTATVASADMNAMAKEAGALLVNMKQSFVDANAQLAKSSDLTAIEEKITALQAQMDALLAKSAGTALATQLLPATNALKAVQVPLQKGDVAGVRAALQKLSAGGPSVPAGSAKSAGSN